MMFSACFWDGLFSFMAFHYGFVLFQRTTFLHLDANTQITEHYDIRRISFQKTENFKSLISTWSQGNSVTHRSWCSFDHFGHLCLVQSCLNWSSTLKYEDEIEYMVYFRTRLQTPQWILTKVKVRHLSKIDIAHQHKIEGYLKSARQMEEWVYGNFS